MRKLGIIVIITIWTLAGLWFLLIFSSAVIQTELRYIEVENKGYRAGRLDAFGELYFCEGMKDEAIVRGYLATVQAMENNEEEIGDFYCELTDSK